MRTLLSLVSLAAAILTAGAGVYLLTKHSTPIDLGGAVGQSWFEIIAHGVGLYFIARGLWMFAETLRSWPDERTAAPELD